MAWGLVTAAVASHGCSGQTGGGADNEGGAGGSDGAGGDGASVAAVGCNVENAELLPARVWRLSHTQYANAVLDLLPKADLSAAKSFLQDEQLGAFLNDAASLRVSSVRAEQYAVAAQTLATRAGMDAATLLPCGLDKADDACAKSFVETFAKRAFRRPVEPDEQTELMAVWQEGKAAAGATGGVKAVVEVLLQSPSFLYRTELGAPGAKGDRITLTSNEMASALSFSLTNRPPDNELAGLAADGKLSSPDTIREQTRRLLQTPEGQATFASFVAQWMDYGPLKSQQLSEPAFADWQNAWVPRFNKEIELYVTHVLEKDGATLSDLMLSTTTFADANLAKIYGGNVAGSDFGTLDLGALPRKGLLTMPGFLASHAVDGAAHAVKRGLFVNERLLCRTIPPPPAGASELNMAARQPGLTARERLQLHRHEDRCASCHATIDPPGLVFERFDGVGRYRTQDNGKDIDTAGSLQIDDNVTINFSDVNDFAEQVTNTDLFKNCAVQQQVRFFAGVSQTDSASCGVRAIAYEVDKAGGRLDRLVEAIVTSPLFRFRSAAAN
ncbi:MAG: DUF1588 domain-containing protein [Deltaproteobacteria bacterium]|nr:DUF1588 domain-containing protein [Deltaproteobacteria bacterium]